MEESVTPDPTMPADSGRPRVLLADDDPGILKAISRTLAGHFHVVATVADGQQAVDTVLRLDPDIAVLDVSMPRMNGFQTAAELKRSGARTRTVFLTMHQDDDFVAKAIRCGAMGFVPKTLAWSDLVPALRHALAGRRSLPSLAPVVMADADAHAVQFHRDDSSWLDRVSDVLSRALHRGDIIATALLESNRDALVTRMHERGWNPADLRARGCYLIFDAEEAATQVVRDGRADPDSIAQMVAALEHARTASAAGPRAHLTIIGEIAAVLFRRGYPAAALELERTWDHLTRSLPIFTICAYSTDCCERDAAPGLLARISAHHSVISHAASA